MLQYVNLSTMLKRYQYKRRSAILDAITSINSKVQVMQIFLIWFHVSTKKKVEKTLLMS